MTKRTPQEGADWIVPNEAVRLSGLTARTLRRYADDKLVTVKRLPKGHRRYDRGQMQAIADGSYVPEPQPVPSS